MTGEQLKRWRENRHMSQEQLGTWLGLSRDQVASLELERTSMKENIDAKLQAIDEAMAKSPAPNNQRVTPRFDYSAHKCWTLTGEPMTGSHASQLKKGSQFYRLDNPAADFDEDSGHQIANLYELTAKGKSKCTYLDLDLVTWTVRCNKWASNPLNAAGVVRLNRLLEPKRAGMQEQAVNNPPTPNIFA